MSKIDDLINTYCLDGVEFRELGAVATIKHGKDYKKFGHGSIPVYGSGGIITYVDTYSYNKPTVLIPRKGTIKNIFYVETPFWNVDTIYYTKIDTKQITAKFLYHFMKSINLQSLDTGSGRPSLTMQVLNGIRLPVPPLPVQEEIVDILDKFIKLEAELEAELGAELEARQKQYAYYRDELLNFDENDVDYLPMGQVGMFVRGNGLQKKDFTEKGVGCIHYGQLYTHYGIYADKTKTFTSESLAKKLRKAKKGNLVIATTSENDEDVCKAVAWLGDEDVAVSGDAYIYQHSLNPKYVAYFFKTDQFQKQKRPYITGTKVRRVSGDSMSKIKIPVPPIKEQERIVTILDKFDALVNDISSGLPAEINARRQQYEYYRNQLLTFKEVA